MFCQWTCRELRELHLTGQPPNGFMTIYTSY